MKIRISLTDHGEWSDCWLQTEYDETKTRVSKLEDQFRCFIYPTTWSSLYRSDGFVMYSQDVPCLREWIEESRKYINRIEHDRNLAKMQKTCAFFKRLLFG